MTNEFSALHYTEQEIIDSCKELYETVPILETLAIATKKIYTFIC